jgi:hypothetical protein
MRVLLDESIPRHLKNKLPGHQVVTVTEQGWRSKENGELLALASPVFDVFITADQKLQYQQNLASVDLAVIVLVAYKNRLVDYLPLVPEILETLDTIRTGQVVRLSAVPGSVDRAGRRKR